VNASDVIMGLSAGRELPHPRAENWRWTDLHGAIRKAAPAQIAASALRVTQGEMGQKVATATTGFADIPPMPDSIGWLAKALAGEPLCIELNETPPMPLWVHGAGQNGLCGSHLQMRVGHGVHVVLVEHASTKSTGFQLDLREFMVEPGGRLTRILLNHNNPQGARHHQSEVMVGAGGRYSQFVLDFGASFSRVETHVQPQGPRAQISLSGAYLLDGTDKVDMTSKVRHDHLAGTTRQLVKGVVMGQADAVFQGKFHVARTGQHTDAKMGHHCLLLSDMAKVHAKPELEIYADDVACAHGNTTGALDEAALFYMRQRGLSLAAAKALLVRAFVTEAFEELSDEALQTQILSAIENWLEPRL